MNNPNNNEESDYQPEDSLQELSQDNIKRNFFDNIGDFFKRMIIGILVFTFVKLPSKLWHILTNLKELLKLIKYIRSILRALLYFVIWFSIVFAAYAIFWLDKFCNFWKFIYDWICSIFLSFFHWFHANIGWIWMIVALIGSLYGLLYITLRRRAKKKGIAFNGILGFLKRKKKQTIIQPSDSIDENSTNS